MLFRSGIDVAYSNSYVAKFELGGLSERDSHKIALEAAEVQRTVLELGLLPRMRSRFKHRVSRLLRLFLAAHVARRQTRIKGASSQTPNGRKSIE